VDIDIQIPIDKIPFVVLDVETTGLYPESGDRVIDLSMIRWKGGEIIDTFGMSINPGRPIPKEATAVHGITDSDLVGAPPFAVLSGQVWQYLEGSVIVAHNAPFDVKFINYELANCGYEQWNGIMLCTLQLARRLHNEKHNKLGDVALRMGIQADGAHTAVGDTMTTLRVFEGMIAQLRGMHFETLAHLMRAQGGYLRPPFANRRKKIVI
jgi:DNA polymerase-3 subunit epsilon